MAKSCSIVLVELRGGFVTSLYSPQCFCPWPALPVTRVQLSRADGMSWPRVLPLSLTLGIFQGQDACVCVRRAVVYPQVCVHVRDGANHKRSLLQGSVCTDRSRRRLFLTKNLTDAALPIGLEMKWALQIGTSCFISTALFSKFSFHQDVVWHRQEKFLSRCSVCCSPAEPNCGGCPGGI